MLTRVASWCVVVLQVMAKKLTRKVLEMLRRLANKSEVAANKDEDDEDANEEEDEAAEKVGSGAVVGLSGTRAEGLMRGGVGIMGGGLTCV